MNLTVRNIPENVIDVIRDMAQQEKRSVNNQILTLLETATNKIPAKNSQPNRIDIWKTFDGAWQDDDDPTGDKLIQDIYENRTVGRYDIDL
jgi:hypothetical protein